MEPISPLCAIPDMVPRSPNAAESASSSSGWQWWIFAFLWGVFYLAIPLKLAFSVSDAAPHLEGMRSDEDRALLNVEQAERGSWERQIALSALAIFGGACLWRPSSRRLRTEGALAWTSLFFLGWCLASIAWADEPA